jgi:hypothetical protein
MHRPQPRRAWKFAGTGLLAFALIAGLATWPWNRTELPPAQAQEGTVSTDGVADTEAEALAEAAASGQPVEVLSQRSEMRDVWAYPDGTFTANEYAEPVRLMIDGAWADLDPTLEVGTDGLIRPKVAVSDMVFSAGGDEPLVTMAKNDHVMTLDWTGGLPAPTLKGDTAVYDEVLTGVDLWVTALDSGFTHTLVVESREAAANPALASITWPVTIDGAEVQSTAEGGLTILDNDTLDAWVSTDAPIMWDSSGVAEAAATVESMQALDLGDPLIARDIASSFGRQAEVGISGSGSSIVLTPDQGLLTGADTVYPVYIDPVYRDESREAWAMVASDYPNQEYWKWSDTKNGKGVGTWYDNGPIKRQLFQVPTADYRGKEILDAEFAVTVTYNWFYDNHKTDYDVYLDTVSGFSKSTNWNNKPSYSKIATAQAPAAAGGACKTPTNGAAHAMEWNIKSTMQAAADAGKSSMSFQVRNADENTGTHWIRICNNGQLRIKYNTAPNQPAMSGLSSTNGTCQWGINNDSYVNTLPKTLYAVLTDPDHGDATGWGSNQGKVTEQLRAEFRIYYNGTLKKTWTSPTPLASGTRFEMPLSTSGLATPALGTVITWDVRASDGTSWSKYSSDGRSKCRMIYDPTAPDAPAITSNAFPAGDDLNPMIGKLGDLTFDTAATDTVKYRYFYNYGDAGEQEIQPETTGGSVTLYFMPTIPGYQTVEVWALDAAENASAHASYTFRVTWSDPAGVWELDDVAGSKTVADNKGENPGSVGAGVTLGQPGPGPATAAVFDGTTSAYIATADYGVAPTGQGVSIAARVRVDDLSHDGVVASIDGGLGEAGMVLGYRSLSATSGTFVLSMPDMPMNAFTDYEVTAGTVNTANQSLWVNLVGIWNDATGKMQLYVNGDFAHAGTGIRESAWWGDGTVQIGRAIDDGIWTGNFEGAIADVQVYDRTVPPAEAEHYGWQAEVRTGYWQFNTSQTNTSTGVRTSPVIGTGSAAVLTGGAKINLGPTVGPDGEPVRGPKPLTGKGDLVLDGLGDYATASSMGVDTARSFSLTANVRFDSAAPSKSMTVLSVLGQNTALLEVGYDKTSRLWQMCIAKEDLAAAAKVCTSGRTGPSAFADGQSIAVVFDTYASEAVLYVDGLASMPIDLTGMTPWTASKGLLVGRNQAATQEFAGAVDDVRAYTGVLHDSVITRLSIKPHVELHAT